MKITLLIGLPGSGKTTAAKKVLGETKEFVPSSGKSEERFSRKYIGEDSIILDDIRRVDDLPEPGKYGHIIITDVYLCVESERNIAIDYLLEYYHNHDPRIMLVFFENAPEKCANNSKHRDDDEVVLDHITMLSENYTIPEGAPVEKIWQPKPEPRYQFAPMTVNGKTYTFV